MAAAGAALLRAWRQLAPALPYPPTNWRPPPPAGWEGAVGIFACSGSGSSDSPLSSFSDGGIGNGGCNGWRPAGSPGDGSCWLRKATRAELDAQAAAAAALAEPEGVK